jgi:putative cell wall-binding protein
VVITAALSPTYFADGLSASALNKPILLVKDTLTTAQTDFLRSVTGGKIYIIGGNMAVNDRIASVLALYGQTQRISGETRYETSINIAKTFFADAENVVLAFGEDFPDGLCGGSLASSMNAPVILVANSANKYTMAAEYAAENGITGGIALGGSGRITNNVMQKVFK